MASLTKVIFVLAGVISLSISILLIGTAGIKGFNGSGGEDTLLFQILTYACIPILIGGLISILMLVRPNRLAALVAGVFITLPSIFLTLLSPLYGGPTLLIGLLLVFVSRRIPKKI